MFNLERFIATVSRSRTDSLPSGSPEQRLEVIVEAREPADLEGLRQRLQDALQVDFELAPVFPGSEDSGLVGAEKLAGYHRLTVPGIDFARLDQDPLDLCRYLIDEARLLSAEPGSPVPGSPALGAPDTGPWTEDASSSGSSSGSGGDCKNGPADRGWSLRNMRVDHAWQLTPPPGGRKYGEGVLVGQVDTGYCAHVDLQPPALAKELGWNFIENHSDPRDPFTTGFMTNPGHGGSVGSVVIGRGTLTAPPPPGQGTTGPGIVAGVAPRCRLVPVRGVTGVVIIGGEKLPDGIWWAVRKGCQVISLSLGGLDLKAVRDVIDVAIANHRIVVCAAGNQSPVVVYPAAMGNVVAVAGTNVNDTPWSGSSKGAVVDVSAPAECVWTCWRSKESDPVDAVGRGSGTSYATAEVAGLAALWIAFHGPKLAEFYQGTTLCAAFKKLLRKTARKPAGWNPDQGYGAGIVNAYELLKATPALLAEEPDGAELVAGLVPAATE